MRFLISPFSIFILIKYIFANENIYLLSSSPLITLEQFKICQIPSFIQQVFQLKSLSPNQILAWGHGCGFNIMTVDNVKQEVTFSKINLILPTALTITVQTETNLIWFSDMTYLQAIDFSDVTNPKYSVNQLRSQANSPPIQIEISENSKMLFILTKTKVETYWIEDRFNIQPQPIFDAGESINYLAFQQKAEYLIIGTERRVIIQQLTIDYINKQLKFNLQCLTPYSFTVNSLKFYDENNILVISKFLGMWQINLRDYYLNQDCTKVNLQYIQSPTDYNFMQFIEITPNNKYIITELYYKNVQIYEVEVQNGNASLRLYQEIKISNQSLDIKLLASQQNLVRVSQNRIDFFSRMIPNFQNKIPNIEIGDQSVIVQEPEMKSDLSRRCFLQNNLFLYSKISDGLFIFQRDPINGYLKKLSLYKPFKEDYESALPLIKNPNRLIVGATKIHIVDITDITNPTTILITNFGYNSFDADHFTLNKQENLLFIAAGRAGIVIVDITDIDSPVSLSNIYHPLQQFPQKSAENIILENNEKFLYVSFREMGLLIYNVEDPKNPKYITSLITLGSESISISKDNTLLILNDLQHGIRIIDISDPSNPITLSQIQVEGKSFYSQLIQNDQYLLVASYLSGQIQLLDIRDKKNPIILQKYARQGFSNSDFICLSPDEETAYLALHAGILMIQLYPPHMLFNIDMSLIQRGSQILQNKIMIDLDHVLLVGERIQIKLIPMYPWKSIQFKGVKYYDDFQQYDLPSWAIFSQIDQTLKIEITKDSIDRDSNEISKRSFILQGKEVLLKQDFQRNDILIDSTKSLQIFEDCRHNNIVDTADYVQVSSEDFIKRVFSTYTTDQINHILYILKNKIFYKPIFLNTQKSLKFSITRIPPLVETISSIVIISLKVDQSQGKLLKVQYSSILSYYTEQEDEMRIEGQVDLINKIIAQGGFRFSNSTRPDAIKLTMTIDDTINYPLVFQVSATDKQLIKLNSPVELNKQHPIQTDFSDQFQGSSIYILEIFSYTFNTNVFFDNDNDLITYTAQIQIDGEYKAFPESYWVSFQANEHSFYGSTKASQYSDIVRFKIIASDGYTEVVDYLVIHIDRIPVWYIFQLLAQILGPIIGILGLWKYKSILINQIYKNKFECMPLLLYAGSEFFIQIPLLENQRKLAYEIWKSYFKTINKNQILSEIQQIKASYKGTSQIITSPIEMERIEKKMKTNLKQNMKVHSKYKQECANLLTEEDMQVGLQNPPSSFREQQNKEIQLTEQNVQSPEQNQHQMQSSLLNFCIIQDGKNPEQTQTLQEQGQSQFYSNQSQFLPQNEHSNQDKMYHSIIIRDQNVNILQKSPNKKIIQRIQRSITKQLTSNKHVRKNNNSKGLEFFQSNGDLNAKLILKNVLLHCKNNKKEYSVKVINDLQIESSKLSFCILCFCALSFSELEQISQTILKFLKAQSTQNGFSEKEWYKAYLEVIPHPERIFLNPFPQISILTNEILQTINLMQAHLSESQKILSTEIQAISSLLKWCLIAQTFGITTVNQQFLNKVRGESLEIFPHQILCVKSYKPSLQKSIFSCFKETEVQIQKEFSQNTTIPSWVNKIDVSNGSILIQGKVEHKDIGIHILKIYDTQSFIIKQFKIEIQENQKQKIYFETEEHMENDELLEEQSQGTSNQKGEGLSSKIQQYQFKNTQNSEILFI